MGVSTICYGHTGPEVRLGLRYTKDQCDRVLVEDIRKHKQGLARCIHYPLNGNQQDAVVSFAFNVGVAKACRSTLVRKINAGDLHGASLEFSKWRFGTVNGTPVPLRGLVRRRAAETALFRSTAPWTPAGSAPSIGRLSTIR